MVQPYYTELGGGMVNVVWRPRKGSGGKMGAHRLWRGSAASAAPALRLGLRVIGDME